MLLCANIFFYKVLQEKGLRAELDDRNEKVGYKIREALSMKIPYLIIVGDEEEKSETIAINNKATTPIKA